MFFPSSVNFKGNTIWVCDSHGENRLEYELINKNAELMQSTGLFDSKGREIYEDDILKNPKSDGYEVFRVRWNFPAEYNVRAEGWMGYQAGSYDGKGLEVIGNVHQNPDLLK